MAPLKRKNGTGSANVLQILSQFSRRPHNFGVKVANYCLVATGIFSDCGSFGALHASLDSGAFAKKRRALPEWRHLRSACQV
jgi:hypothetical protein